MAKKASLHDRFVKTATIAASTKTAKGKGKAAEVDAGAVVGLTTRIPVAMHDRLRDYAHENRVSINSLILEGLEWRLKKGG